MPTIPMIHSNGTARQDLIDAVMNASTALQSAMNAMNEAYPNERDYYPLGAVVLERAMHEHDAQYAKVREAMAWYYNLAVAIADA